MIRAHVPIAAIVLACTTACDHAAPEPAFAFADTAIQLPPDTSALPAGPNADVVGANCTACHSATMITMQPALKPEQWAATIRKMREVYKAPIAEGDVAAIQAYLDDLSERRRTATLAPATRSP